MASRHLNKAKQRAVINFDKNPNKRIKFYVRHAIISTQVLIKHKPVQLLLILINTPNDIVNFYLFTPTKTPTRKCQDALNKNVVKLEHENDKDG